MTEKTAIIAGIVTSLSSMKLAFNHKVPCQKARHLSQGEILKLLNQTHCFKRWTEFSNHHLDLLTPGV